MKCILQKATEEILEFCFIDINDETIHVKYSRSSNVLSFNREDENFYYLEHRPGLLKTVMKIKNFKGHPAAQLQIDHLKNDYLLSFYQKHFSCRLQNNRIDIASKSGVKIMYHCTIIMDEEMQSLQKKNANEILAAFIFSACLVVEKTIQADKILQYN